MQLIMVLEKIFFLKLFSNTWKHATENYLLKWTLTIQNTVSYPQLIQSASYSCTRRNQYVLPFYSFGRGYKLVNIVVI